jgi:catechol 2,3-dioxygenase-like lactoylglutathione lyase family enzyme
MIGYATLGSNDLPRAASFYDALLGLIGAQRQWEMPRGIAWGTAPNAPTLAVMNPFNGEPATVGNGVMIGLQVDSREQVAELHAKALLLGGKDEGPVGSRGEGFYGGYFRDLDGNKLCVFYPG